MSKGEGKGRAGNEEDGEIGEEKDGDERAGKEEDGDEDERGCMAVSDTFSGVGCFCHRICCQKQPL